MIRNDHPGFGLIPIPDPGVIKAPDPDAQHCREAPVAFWSGPKYSGVYDPKMKFL